MIFAHLADIHFGTEDSAALDAAREVILSSGASALVVSGDLTQRGKRSEFLAAREYLESFALPVLSVPGNHDTPLLHLGARVSDPFGRYDNHLAQYSGDIDTEAALIRGLNTSRGWQARSNWAEGSVNLSRLDAALAPPPSGSRRLRAIACHHPFLHPAKARLRTSTRRGREASRRLAASGVSVLLTGHVHTPHAEIIAEPEGRYLAISAGTLSTRLRAELPSFNLLTVGPNCLTLSVQTFENGDYAETADGRWSLDTLEPLGTPRVVTVHD